MKTTIDLPDELLHRAKIRAAEHKTTLKDLVIRGLDQVLTVDERQAAKERAIARMKTGLNLGGRPLTREEIYDRR